jgi:hypothetical protein
VRRLAKKNKYGSGRWVRTLISVAKRAHVKIDYASKVIEDQWPGSV